MLRMHSSEIRGLRSTKCSSETLQNLLYFMYKKTHVVFFRFSFRATLYFYLMNALVYVDIDQSANLLLLKSEASAASEDTGHTSATSKVFALGVRR